MANYTPTPVIGGVIAAIGGTSVAAVLPQTGVRSTLQIAISAAVALVIWAGMYLLGQKKSN